MGGRTLLVAGALLAIAFVPAAGAFHFYRNTGSGCSAEDGPTGGTPTGSGATVLVLHDSFHDDTTGGPLTVVSAGESVTWVWWSSHCHSATHQPDAGAPAFDSGLHYPTAVPESPGTPGTVYEFFSHPVPDTTPTLSYTFTFDTPGTYQYYCIHHRLVGMVGVVVVE